jgi:hypothetical protein
MDAPLSTVTVSSTSYPAADSPSWSCPFEPDQITLISRSSTAADIVYYSFDRTNDAGILIPGICQGQVENKKRQKIWLRLASAGSVDVTIQAGTVR